MSDESLRYPVGRFSPKPAYSREELDDAIGVIKTFPENLETTMRDFSDTHFNTRYRDGGWNGRQVIHHLADSHMNAYIRFKWTLTEGTPMIKAYDEKAWAETPETALDPRMSADLVRALHSKWGALLESLTSDDLAREYIHPESKKKIRLDRMVVLYAWHCNHHLGHLKIIADKLR